MVISFAHNKNYQKVVEEQAVRRDHKRFQEQPTCQDFSFHFESFSTLHGSTVP